MLGAINSVLIDDLVRRTLAEDLGHLGDITTEALIPPDRTCHAVLRTRKDGRIAGLAFAESAFRLADDTAVFTPHIDDGSFVMAGSVLAEIHGRTAGVLVAERTALNFLGHLSGVATATAKLVQQVADLPVKIACTRKTTPLLRFAEKYAVRMGGGSNHRASLSDAVLIKDNHIAAVGSIVEAVRRARAKVGHTVKIEVEVDSLEQLREILPERPDIILLDNFTLTDLSTAVGLAKGQVILEASGSITDATVRAIAETGVDVISVGWITHSAPVLDIGLDF